MMQRWLISYLLWLVCLLPGMTCAHHLLSITPTVPFPATVHIYSSSTAIYTITNLASQITVIPIDQSILPCDSGMQIISNNCGVPIAPGHTCQLILSLHAPATPQMLKGQIRVWAKPSADAVRLPFSINVIGPQQFTLTPHAGVNGSINPSTPQIVNKGSNATFTATPNTGYEVNQWFLDGFLDQIGGTTYTLTNITADHTINVTFKVQEFTVNPQAGNNGSITPSTPQTVNFGSSLTFTATPNTGFEVNQWLLDGIAVQTGGTTYDLDNITANHTVNVTFQQVQFTVTPQAGSGGTITPNVPQIVNLGNNLTFTATPTTSGFVVNQWFLDGTLVQGGGTTYTLNNITADHIVNVTFVLAPLLTVGTAYQNFNIDQIPLVYTSSDGGDNWSLSPSLDLGATLPLKSLFGVSCWGTPGTTCVGVGDALDGSSIESPVIYTTADGGVSWSAPIQAPTLTYPSGTDNGQLFSVTCDSSNCVAVGQAFLGTPSTQTKPLAYSSSDGGSSWSSPKTFVLPSLPVPQDRGGLSAVACVGNACATVGSSFSGVTQIPLVYSSSDGGNTWAIANPQPLPLPGAFTTGELLGISCVGTNCVAVGEAGSEPLAYTSIDNGVNWALASSLPFSGVTGTLYAVNCISTHCIAVGEFSDGSVTTPLGYTSNDSGNTWTELVGVFAQPSGQNQGTLYSVTCADVNCIADGDSNSSGNNHQPLAYKSTNGGTAWTLLPNFNLPTLNTSGDLFGVVSGNGVGSSHPPV